MKSQFLKQLEEKKNVKLIDEKIILNSLSEERKSTELDILFDLDKEEGNFYAWVNVDINFWDNRFESVCVMFTEITKHGETIRIQGQNQFDQVIESYLSEKINSLNLD